MRDFVNCVTKVSLVKNYVLECSALKETGRKTSEHKLLKNTIFLFKFSNSWPILYYISKNIVCICVQIYSPQPVLCSFFPIFYPHFSSFTYTVLFLLHKESFWHFIQKPLYILYKYHTSVSLASQYLPYYWHVILLLETSTTVLVF